MEYVRLPNFFLAWLCYLMFLATIWKIRFFTFSPAFAANVTLKKLPVLIYVFWYLTVVLIYIYLMATDVKHFCMLICHLKILLGEMFVQVFCPFSNWIDLLLLLCSENSVYILNTNSLSDIWLANILFRQFVFSLS